ncbi:MAG: hypothetical protein M9945_12380 [Aquamicrobium sp.]|uniref:hypothetical protein n=1 Tax=Aquamicrobium sp. TaxID=1872579 RepID=UPI00349EF9D0|nr:hypothetical protein [Aquamicrobium sp.]
MSDRASELRAIADGRLMLHVRNGVTVSRSMLARIADEFETMSTALAAKDAELAAVRAERDEAVAKWNDADGDMAGAALHAIRETLYAGEVPLAAFIDDHVANAIVQRNQERERAEYAEAQLAEANKALEQVAEQLSKSATAAREGADKCTPAERDTYLAFAEHLSGFAQAARRALEAQGGENGE